ncbi:YncE family protein [Tenggerimyces flavus]|uniref:YncE family protein n=1 Tax=Tenggerimyces flavus TaxID=1708749 RepID=A0ABV7Y5F7_9ACTN|nr:hypothetical protein [Tenggerimyces flavus]MBM7790865.1 hypothetical protein [Tenggerimyces flavus]
MLRKTVRTLAGATLAATLIATAAPAAQAANTQTELPFNTFGDIVATNTRIFISGGETSTSIVVARPTGSILGEIRNLPGPTDLQLSADRRLLYVALHGGGIAAFDTQSLEERARYDTGDTCPGSLALSKRRLYFGYNCSRHGYEGNVGLIDLDHPSSPPRLPLIAPAVLGVPLLNAPTSGANVLLVSETVATPGDIYLYASDPDGGLTRLRKSDHGSLGEALTDLAISSDGSTAYSTSAWPYGIVEFATNDLSVRRVLPTRAFPNAVDASPDGRLLASGSFSCCDPDLFFFRTDGTPTGVVELGDDLFHRALTWSPTGRRLYAVTGDIGWNERPAVLHVLNAPR